MLFFRKKENDPDGESRRSAGLAALSQGGLMPEARTRLASPVRSTDLSCSEFLLTRSAGFESLGVVMGSAFHRLNTSYLPTEQRTRYVGELADLTSAHRNARSLAIERLRGEAAALGAHGVVGVRLAWKKARWSMGMVECTAIGTAIRMAGTESTDRPFTSNLSGSEFWLLHESGYIPRDIVFGVSVYMVACDDHTRRIAFNPFGGGWSNQEIVSLNSGLMEARRLATARLARSIALSEGEGGVGMEVDHHFHDLEYEIGNTTYVDMLITFAAVGTSVLARSDAMGQVPPRPVICRDLGK